MRNLTLVLLGSSVLLLAGCQAWQPGGANVAGKNNAFAITPPAGWMYTTVGGADLLASKEGPVLQRIVVEHADLGKLPKGAKRAVAPGMNAFEAAEAVIGELRGDHDLLGFDLKENTPASVGGHPGFKIVFSYRTADRLHLAEARYGALVGDVLWLVRYAAPARHYFERDAPAFESAMQTFRIGGGAVATR